MKWILRLGALAALTEYRPKMPLRICTVANVLTGEFGRERRDFQILELYMNQIYLGQRS
jgi:membrane carboxypeptidase/penicillin-binding protein